MPQPRNAQRDHRPVKIRIGIGGWTFAPWRANFYPPGLVQKRELEYASRHVTAIEINGTFYRAPAPSTYAQWRAQTPDGFVFSVKAPGRITQRKPLAGMSGAAAAFVAGGLAELGDRLGPVLWQLPETTPFAADDLATFLHALPRTLNGAPLRHAIEVRHPSFACAEFIALARSAAVTIVHADSATYPRIADLSGDCVYLRVMQARPELPAGYPAEVLDRWAQRARLWAAGDEPDDVPRLAPALPKQPRDVFMYFIAAAKERNPAAAMAVIERLRNG